VTHFLARTVVLSCSCVDTSLYLGRPPILAHVTALTDVDDVGISGCAWPDLTVSARDAV